MWTYYLKFPVFIGLLWFSSMANSAVANSAIVNSAPLEVFVSILPQQYLLERIGGERVNVNVMVKPGQSPETFEPSPKMMSRYSVADVYFTIGLPFEQVWIERVASLNNTALIINTQKELSQPENKPMAQHGHQHDWDPHTWLSPLLFLQQAKVVVQTLNALSPEDKSYFDNNYKQLTSDINVMHKEFSELFEHKTVHRFITFHPAFSYFAHQYGLTQIAIEVDGKEPSAKQIAQIIERIRHDKVSYILVEKQFNQVIPQTIARSVKAELLILDPLALDYLLNMKDIADKISRALF